MDDKIKMKVQELLQSGKIKGFLGLRERHGQVGPYLFTDGDDLEGLVVGDRFKPGDSRYPLNKQLMKITRGDPSGCYGVLVRGCDERGLKTLFGSGQIKSEQVVPVGIACPQDLADACECLKPYPDERVAGEAAEPRSFATVAKVEAMELEERFRLWLAEFSKCIKCYGCRNICPMCYCSECTLENKDFGDIGSLPAENPVFHLTRAIHMAGRCIDCGLCNEVCPADIPLRTLYKKIADIVEEEFHCRPGYGSPETPPGLNIRGEELKH